MTDVGAPDAWCRCAAGALVRSLIRCWSQGIRSSGPGWGGSMAGGGDSLYVVDVVAHVMRQRYAIPHAAVLSFWLLLHAHTCPLAGLDRHQMMCLSLGGRACRRPVSPLPPTATCAAMRRMHARGGRRRCGAPCPRGPVGREQRPAGGGPSRPRCGSPPHPRPTPVRRRVGAHSVHAGEPPSVRECSLPKPSYVRYVH